MKKGLLIIDVQNDYFPGGANELFEVDKALTSIQKLIHAFRLKELPIIYVQHESKKGSGFFEKGTVGYNIHSAITPQATDSIVIKHNPSSFLDTKLQQILTEKKIDELYVCGMMSHMCVDTTVRLANDLGYKVTLFSDACTTSNLSYNGEILPADFVHKVFMAALNGAFATVITTDQLTLK